MFQPTKVKIAPRKPPRHKGAVIIVDIATYAHVPWALGIQAIGWLLAWLLGARHRVGAWLGAFAATVMAVTREVTQAEYRWIEAYGHGLRRNMPDLAGFYLWEWNAHSIAETVAATGAVGMVAIVISLRETSSSRRRPGSIRTPQGREN